MSKLSDRRGLALLGGAGLALMLTACGTNPSAQGTETSHTPGHAKAGHHAKGHGTHRSQPTGAASGGTSTTGGSSSSSGGSSSPAGPAQCTTGQLHLSLVPGGSAAGSSYVQLVLTNTGHRACRTGGFSGVSFVGHGNGTQVGAPAVRQQPGKAHTIVLHPGQKATATLQETDALNYPRTRCHPTAVDGLRVYPPNQTASLFVRQDGATGCANPKVQLLFIQPWVAASGQ
jgi:hypothetical protein